MKSRISGLDMVSQKLNLYLALEILLRSHSPIPSEVSN